MCATSNMRPSEPVQAKSSSFFLFPRRKQGAPGAQRGSPRSQQPVKLDYQTIQALFGMPQPNAARMLGIALTTLKQVCRRFGIARWPYTRTFYDTGRARQSSPVDGSACSYFARSVEPQSDASDVAMVDESDSQGDRSPTISGGGRGGDPQSKFGSKGHNKCA